MTFHIIYKRISCNYFWRNLLHQKAKFYADLPDKFHNKAIANIEVMPHLNFYLCTVKMLENSTAQSECRLDAFF